jgi:hypothetical protein
VLLHNSGPAHNCCWAGSGSGPGQDGAAEGRDGTRPLGRASGLWRPDPGRQGCGRLDPGRYGPM